MKFGRLPNNPDRPRIKLSAALLPQVSYDPPAAVDYWSRVPEATWGMDGNDDYGDCTCAEVDHAVKTWQVAGGNPEVQSSSSEVLALYSAVTGFTPSDPNTDNGAEMQAVRSYWQKHGATLGGRTDKILLFAQVDHTDQNLLRWCVQHFGEVGLGVNFPDSAMDQFNKGQPWTVVKGAKIEGGHAIALVGYDTDFAYIITWGAVQKVAWAWLTKYLEEAWISLSADFVNSVSNSDPLNETLYVLGQQFARLTGKPNPIAPPAPAPQPQPVPPIPTPTPVPEPTPEPTPMPATGFPLDLYDALKAHHRSEPRYRAFVAAVDAWLAGS